MHLGYSSWTPCVCATWLPLQRTTQTRAAMNNCQSASGLSASEQSLCFDQGVVILDPELCFWQQNAGPCPWPPRGHWLWRFFTKATGMSLQKWCQTVQTVRWKACVIWNKTIHFAFFTWLWVSVASVVIFNKSAITKYAGLFLYVDVYWPVLLKNTLNLESPFDMKVPKPQQVNPGRSSQSMTGNTEPNLDVPLR